MSPHHKEVTNYVNDIISGKKHGCKEVKQACKRYQRDLKNKDFEFHIEKADLVIDFIENSIVLLEGEDVNGEPFSGRPFLLQTWQKFIIYNLFGFYKANTNIRRFTEGFIFIPKKQGKTPFASAISLAFGVLFAKSNSKILLTSFTLTQALFSFNFIKQNLQRMGKLSKDGEKLKRGKYRLKLIDNNQEHSISGEVTNGRIHIQAFSGMPKDGLNGSFVIADEIHQYKQEEQYTYYQKAMKAYRNKLLLAITTAGEDTNSFCFRRLKTCQKILNGTFKDEEYFVFITKADQNEDGKVDYLNPIEHEKANPGYGVTVMPEELARAAKLADQEKGATLSGFLAKELNIYMPSLKAYFNLDTLQSSNHKYKYTLDDLAKLPILWYGGGDLSKFKDLTATCLYGHHQGVDIIIPHAWFPITRAHEKAKKDNIDLFGWQNDGFLDMCNANTIQQSDMVQWFVKMRQTGFRIKEIRYDHTFGEEFAQLLKSEKFKIVDQPQLYKKTTKGFQRIDKMAEEGKLYYMEAELFEYCCMNVAVSEKVGGYIEFRKLGETHRIDAFAAAVFAAVGMLENDAKLMAQHRIMVGGVS